MLDAAKETGRILSVNHRAHGPVVLEGLRLVTKVPAATFWRRVPAKLGLSSFSGGAMPAHYAKARIRFSILASTG